MDGDLLENNRFIANDDTCCEIIKNVENNISFLENISFNFMDQIFLYSNRIVNFYKQILSAKITLINILNCMKNYCTADAMTLLRKFKDDLFLILYLLKFKDMLYLNEDKILTRNAKNWFNNKMSGIGACDIIGEIFKTKELKEVDEKYKIKNSLSKMAKTLNNYVHSKGYDFINSLITQYDLKINDDLLEIEKIISQIILIFVIVLAIAFPSYISSDDYISALECGCEPEDGSQYWVAPFIIDFIINNSKYLDRDLIDFLNEKSCMKFE